MRFVYLELSKLEHLGIEFAHFVKHYYIIPLLENNFVVNSEAEASAAASEWLSMNSKAIFNLKHKQVGNI